MPHFSTNVPPTLPALRGFFVRPRSVPRVSCSDAMLLMDVANTPQQSQQAPPALTVSPHGPGGLTHSGHEHSVPTCFSSDGGSCPSVRDVSASARLHHCWNSTSEAVRLPMVSFSSGVVLCMPHGVRIKLSRGKSAVPTGSSSQNDGTLRDEFVGLRHDGPMGSAADEWARLMNFIFSCRVKACTEAH